ncbi:MAG: hypothetical protein OXN86_03900 [Chloroflexota bacterium]|nr:hypothetical protein [Chloroflexota bacterium]
MIRRALTGCRAVAWAAIASIAIAASLALTSPARAEGGVPIPAPAGTMWSIVAGYNTSTHSVSDGNDPHAIDLVRVPREETAFTSVLAPVNGTVAWRGWDGLSITDAAGFDHVLAHVAPLDHIQRGVRVQVGEQVATVCRAYECRNNGLAHIHYAVHRSQGGGYLGPSVPFTGEYAIEGRELHEGDAYNLHAGVEFTSTNTHNWTPPTVTTPADDPTAGDPPESDQEPVTVTEPEPAPAWTIPADAPIGGWRTVGVQRNTSVAGLYSLLEAPLSELVFHDSQRNTYHRFDPNDPASADVAVRSLSAGEAVWALVDPYVPWLPAPPTEPRQVTIRLRTGANLISWQGPDRDIDDALRNVAHFSRAYRYDPYTDTWQLWSPDAPDFLNTLTELKSGDALYIVVRVGSIWTQLP